MKTITIIDDSHIDTQLLRKWLEAEMFKVTSLFHSSVDAIAKTHEITSDICLVDAHMPLICGVDVITLLHKRGYVGKTILISHAFHLKCLADAKQAGACAYLNKDKNSLLLGLSKIATDQHCFDYDFFEQWDNDTKQNNLHKKDKDPRIYTLNSHHLNILKYTCKGLSTDEMCELMQLKKHTIEQYRASMLQLLGFTNLAQATAWAVANHVIKHSDVCIPPIKS